jgi:hypothetical protein
VAYRLTEHTLDVKRARAGGRGTVRGGTMAEIAEMEAKEDAVSLTHARTT